MKTIEELDHYPWSGHSAIVGKIKRPWTDIETALLHIGDVKRRAISRYRSFVIEEFGSNKKPELTGGLIRSQGGWSKVFSLRRSGQKEEFDERILGSGDFVQAVLRETEDRQLRQTKLRKRGKGIADIIREECRARGVKEKELALGSRRRKVSLARAAIALRCKEEIGCSGAEIARHLGVNTTASIGQSRGRKRQCECSMH